MLQRTNAEGIPSTRIIRRSFFVPSSVSPVARDFEAALGWLRSLLKEWAVAADIRESTKGLLIHVTFCTYTQTTLDNHQTVK